MICASCTHFSTVSATNALAPPNGPDSGDAGVCRRYPPRLFQLQKSGVVSFFPSVHRNNSCGEYGEEMPC